MRVWYLSHAGNEISAYKIIDMFSYGMSHLMMYIIEV